MSSAPDGAPGNRSPSSHSAPPAPMLDIDGFAAVLGVSSRHVRRLVDAGKCPPPVRLGKCCRWPRATVEQWVADGCPNCRRRPGGAR